MAKRKSRADSWNDDIAARRERLTKIAELSNTEIQTGMLVSGAGRYLILHFDLITITATRDLNRDSAYAQIQELIAVNSGVHLGGSVYVVPLLDKYSASKSAIKFWNLLHSKLTGHLAAGDVFVLHYADPLIDQVRTLAQMVGPDGQLRKVRNRAN